MSSSRSLLLAISAAIAVLFSLGAASAQQTCNEIDAVILQCQDSKLISGEPPNCFCDAVPVEQLELTCEQNFGCPDSSYVGDGDFPECWCRKLKDGQGGGASSGGGSNGGAAGAIGGSMGGAATCEQFFECPSGSEMEVQGGQCTCTLVMLPAVKE